LRDVAQRWARITAPVGGIIAALVTATTLTVAQGDALSAGLVAVNLLFGAITGLVTAVSAAVAAFKTANSGAEHVTPVGDPQDNQGRRLTPEGT
jgi:hypothetical protein